MAEVVVRAEALGKRYRLGERERYRHLGAALTRGVAARLRGKGYRDDASPERDDLLWALRDVSFEVREGETFGVIGSNGAGKSTLLKILSRITRPTTGVVRMTGQVASLLEVGTGFHPELTGRENVLLNGVILGMKRREVNRRFDAIVDFSGIAPFLDTPVKRYSSGMYLRLAFAVAAHLEPDILIVDEVLAVGDVEFQRKCLGKMDEVAREGRTVFFVSHNINAVQRLCTRSLALESGRVASIGETRDVVAWYLGETAAMTAADEWIEAAHLPRQRGGDNVRVIRFSCGTDGSLRGRLPHPEGPLEVKLLLEAQAARSLASVAITISDQFGAALVNADVVALGETVQVKPGHTLVTFRIRALHLTPGTYVLGWRIGDAGDVVYDFVERAIQLDVVDTAAPGLGARSAGDGVVTCDFSVSIETQRGDDGAAPTHAATGLGTRQEPQSQV